MNASAMLEIVPRRDEVLFTALGGIGEIGMNCALYGHDGQWMMVDLGVVFGDENTPGIDVIVPDISFAELNKGRLAGLVLTHAHEDHLGAVPHLWKRLGCPIYATPFTAAFLKRKLADEGMQPEGPIRIVSPGERFRVGPFQLEMVQTTHSIPEPQLLAIRCGLGTVIHTGDWKLDPDPVIGEPVDAALMQALGDENPLAVMCDSTNAMVDGEAGSEASLRDSLTALIAAAPQRVAIGCFASNVARIRTIVDAAHANDRRVALVGRSMRRIEQVARETGYMDGVPEFVSEEFAGYLPRDKVVLICTGSQGEPQAALRRIADGSHQHVVLEPGDMVAFSSRMIPGNEKAIGALQNQFVRNGVEVVTDRECFIHVSGHPARDELRQMYRWLRPQHVFPVHGEIRHLLANAELAEACGVPGTTIADNGRVARIGRNMVEIIGEVPVGRRALDGKRVIRLDGEAMRIRRRLVEQGNAVLTIVADRGGSMIVPPQLALQGLAEPEELPAIQAQVIGEVERALGKLAPQDRRDDAKLSDTAKAAVRRAVKAAFGKRPVTDVHLVRLGG